MVSVSKGRPETRESGVSFDGCRSLSPGVVCLVVTVMYWSGWEIGAVEAVSLSILVGSSVDYCVHLVEGFLLAGESLPPHLAEVRLCLGASSSSSSLLRPGENHTGHHQSWNRETELLRALCPPSNSPHHKKRC